jgi:hypothetical protein
VLEESGGWVYCPRAGSVYCHLVVHCLLDIDAQQIGAIQGQYKQVREFLRFKGQEQFGNFLHDELG